MRKIPIILGAIIVTCIIALIVINMIPESIPPSVEELACMEAGFPVESISVKDCAELLRLENDVLRLNQDLDQLRKYITPGIDI